MTRLAEEIRVEAIDEFSPYLESIRSLHRANASTLGQFPDGAFIERAARKQILVALDSQNNVLGYLVYRVAATLRRATIVHLCVSSRYRNRGIGKKLVDHLKQLTRSLTGIRVTCRRDYAINDVWPRLGFTAQGEQPGRRAAGSQLVIWWYDHGQPSLFSLAEEQDIRPKAVLDANIFFDLSDEEIAPKESLALMAPWLSDEVLLCLTREIGNEINRNNDPAQREKHRRNTSRFHTLQSNDDQVTNIQQELGQFFPDQSRPSDRSDVAQLAHAVAAEASFFITRDADLLQLAPQVQDRFGLVIVNPSEPHYPS